MVDLKTGAFFGILTIIFFLYIPSQLFIMVDKKPTVIVPHGTVETLCNVLLDACYLWQFLLPHQRNGALLVLVDNNEAPASRAHLRSEPSIELNLFTVGFRVSPGLVTSF